MSGPNRGSKRGLVVVATLCAGLLATQARAEITITERNAMRRQQRHAAKAGTVRPLARGSDALVDAGGVKYFINDDISTSNTYSESGAMSEASYTHAVAASTSGGGTTASTLNDAFDGYASICVSFTGHTGPCHTGDSDYWLYADNGPATSECLGSASGVNRQYVFGTATMGPLHVFRKVFVPDNEQFARWLNYFTNFSGAPVTFNVITANNLGSDADTVIVSSSTGSNASPFTDTSATWVTTFQNWGSPAANRSSDPRLGHVMQGVGAPVPVSLVNFVNGQDKPFWAYTLTLQPGETKIIMTFVAVQPTKAAAAAKAAMLAGAPPIALQCMSPTDAAEVVNFAAQLANIPALSRTGIAVLAALLLGAAALVLRTKTA